MDILTQKYIKLLLVIHFILLICFLLFYFHLLLIPFVFALYMGHLIQPIINLSIKWTRLPRRIIAFLLVSLFILLLTWIAYLFLQILFQEVKAFVHEFPMTIATIKQIYETFFLAKYSLLQESVPILRNVQAIPIETLLQSVQTFLLDQLDVILQQLATLFSSFSYGTMSFFIFILVFYMFSMDYPLFKDIYQKFIPNRMKQSAYTVYQHILQTIVKLIRAQLVLSFLTAILSLIGLLLISFKQALLISLLLFFIDIIPYIGVGLFFLPMIGYYLLIGQTFSTLSLLITYIIIIIFRQIMEPKVVGSSIGIHPLLVLFIFSIAFHFFGLFAFIFAPGLIIIIAALYHAKVFHTLWHYIHTS